MKITSFEVAELEQGQRQVVLCFDLDRGEDCFVLGQPLVDHLLGFLGKQMVSRDTPADPTPAGVASAPAPTIAPANAPRRRRSTEATPANDASLATPAPATAAAAPQTALPAGRRRRSTEAATPAQETTKSHSDLDLAKAASSVAKHCTPKPVLDWLKEHGATAVNQLVGGERQEFMDWATTQIGGKA